eukprot:CAMPEP_0119279946 /NCGR_PEP_ID=MMETSP1329-20130426/21785_1 /TAXON_ID=114041 /ORGANISM="Genus nov. species nov., Strain RCC1024" /LENGTH=66 /DNA_ID=CAMNT_0007280511 /DNA_START=95 /DNA_END=292 /DNA_ORIENTATION=+
MAARERIPTLDATTGPVAWSDVAQLYETHRAVHIVGAAAPRHPRACKWLREIGRLAARGLADATYC